MIDPIEPIRKSVRGFMTVLARSLVTLTGGRLKPNFVTLSGLAMHIPIAWLIATRANVWAAVMLVVFGLFDSLDGALARALKQDSNSGMLLDASTDRMKEVMLYIGCAYALVAMGKPYMSVWAVAACGGSLLVSYVKAKGETAVAGKMPANKINRLFQDGFFRYEIRMTLLVIGLLTSQLLAAVIIISLSSCWTAVSRLVRITNRLNSV